MTYITLCAILQAQTARCFPNNKHWIPSELKVFLNKKKEAFCGQRRNGESAAWPEEEAEGGLGQSQQKSHPTHNTSKQREDHIPAAPSAVAFPTQPPMSSLDPIPLAL